MTSANWYELVGHLDGHVQCLVFRPHMTPLITFGVVSSEISVAIC